MSSENSILIIDDDTHLAATFALGLEANGYRVTCAPNATVGWEAAHADRPDLILCDIEMPGKDGRRLLKEMRADAALADRQFVLMTGKPAYGNQRAAMDLGADDFLLKPVKLPTLLACVSTRLRRAQLSRRLDDRTVAQLRENLHANIPHMFFNPLAVILGLTELLQGDLESLSPSEVRQDLHDIHLAGRRLHRCLRNYLLILELEAPGTKRAGDRLDPDAVVEALTLGIGAASERHQRGTDIKVELVGVPLRARSADLTTLVEELVDNALCASLAGTPVRMRTWTDGTHLWLSVEDCGRGLTQTQIEHLGTFQQHERAAREQHGLGLGLALVHLLLGHLGGRFYIESEPGVGTTSHVALPVAIN